MNRFCTSCGMLFKGDSFCISCGKEQKVLSPDSSELAPIDTSDSLETHKVQTIADAVSEENPINHGVKSKSKKKAALAAAALILFAGGSVAAYFLGKSSIDLEKERKISYDSGYNLGKSTGDSAGYSRGYSSGKTEGCRGVFTFSDGTYDYVTPYDPYNFYNRYPGSRYYAKSNC